MKTARFSALVEKGGRPSVHLAWAPPAKDRLLQQALKENRVVTIHQQARGSKKDYAVLGLELGHDAQHLIFPKSLRSFRDHRIIGIQYDLLDDSLSVGSAPIGRALRERGSKSAAKKVGKVIPFESQQAPVPPVQPVKARQPVPPAVVRQPKAPRVGPAAKKIIRQALTDLESGYPSKAEQGLRFLLQD